MPSLGETLKERRVQLGITLQQAEADTKIRARSLGDLEEGNYANLPSPGYVRGYVTSYAKYLELDPMQMIAMYRAETGNARPHRIVPPDEAVKPRADLHAIPWRGALLVVGAIVLVALLIWGISLFNRRPAPVPPIPTQTTTGTGGAQLTTAPFTLNVAVAQNGASAVKVTVDGKVAYQGTLTGGQSQQFQVTSSASVSAGTPSVVTVTRDGQPVHLKVTNGHGTVTLTAAQ